MKIKSIAAICKKNKNIAIFERYSGDGDILTQYIGDGSAVYPVVGLPPLDAESLLTIFDLSLIHIFIAYILGKSAYPRLKRLAGGSYPCRIRAVVSVHKVVVRVDRNF